MNVLIVDDQYDGKIKSVSRILRDLGVSNVKHVMSSFDAISALTKNRYDLLILDLHIPQRLGDEIDSDGGRSLLQRIELDPKLNRPTTILGITAQRDAFSSAQAFFADRGWTLLLDADGSAIHDQLNTILATQIAHLTKVSQECDVFIITALAHTELEAVLKLPCTWTSLKLLDRPEVYYEGTFMDRDGQSRKVITTSLPTMGMAAAAAISAFVCATFTPQYLIMTGIAAGIPNKVNLGDIMIAAPSWDWGSGKLTVKDGKPQFLSSPVQVPLAPELHALMSSIAASKRYVDQIYLNWKNKKPTHQLAVHVGPIASGAVVLEDPATVELIRAQHRATIGIEMEAFGVMTAAYYSGNGGPKALVVKSVCDFADPNKNDDWQEYAAYTSAQFAFEILKSELAFDKG
ncbi:response regulator [Janthinobacterium sp. SUN073]|uniref:phosphorylase family protein n=1 Tax=Janthinobacterium sp. SUN073 TaxID=3004102 RepID=UPI0025B08474|nr:response regulator [Janthinobacterium sp. SUN073]MDN2696269.1 response regulator [Janthinobacterium sp. SUN073]